MGETNNYKKFVPPQIIILQKYFRGRGQKIYIFLGMIKILEIPNESNKKIMERGLK